MNKESAEQLLAEYRKKNAEVAKFWEKQWADLMFQPWPENAPPPTEEFTDMKKMIPAMAAVNLAALSAATSLDMPMLVPENNEPEPDDVAETPPDRLSVDRRSPYWNVCYKRMNVYLDEIKRPGDVQEYCVSEGWIDVRKKNLMGKWRIGEDGTFLVDRLYGKVEPRFTRTLQQMRPSVVVPHDADAAKRRAEEKRARKAAKLAAR